MKPLYLEFGQDTGLNSDNAEDYELPVTSSPSHTYMQMQKETPRIHVTTNNSVVRYENVDSSSGSENEDGDYGDIE